MGVIIQKVPGRNTGLVERVVNICHKFVEGFMNFADVGFRYIDIPANDELNRPKKKIIKEAKPRFKFQFYNLKPSFQH